MGVQAVLFAVYVGVPALAAAVAGALLRGWRGAAGLAFASLALFLLAPGVIPPLGVLYPILAGAGLAALVLAPVLFLRPAIPAAMRALIGALPVVGGGTYIVLSNPGIA